MCFPEKFLSQLYLWEYLSSSYFVWRGLNTVRYFHSTHHLNFLQPIPDLAFSWNLTCPLSLSQNLRITLSHIQGPTYSLKKSVHRKWLTSAFKGCALAEPSGPWGPTFPPEWLRSLIFFLYKSYAGQPRFYRFRTLGFLQFSLEHSLGLIHVNCCLCSIALEICSQMTYTTKGTWTIFIICIPILINYIITTVCIAE